MSKPTHPDFRPNGQFIGDTMEDYIDRQRKLVKCRKCESFWRSDLIDDCLCGFAGICPNCMKTHYCRGGTV